MEKMKIEDKIEELERGDKSDSQWKSKKKQRFLSFPVPGKSDACQGLNGWLGVLLPRIFSHANVHKYLK